MSLPTEPKEFEIKYIIPDHLVDYYVNGIYGGVTPRNEINMHFFSERHPLPKKETYIIDTDGKFSEKSTIELGGNVVRFVQTSIVIDVNVAVSIRDWLDDRINEIRKKPSK